MSGALQGLRRNRTVIYKKILKSVDKVLPLCYYITVNKKFHIVIVNRRPYFRR